MGQLSTYRKDSVVITAIEIISEVGIRGLTSKEIAKREGISEGTLFSHYKNMDEIIMAVLDYYSELDASIIETIEMKNLIPTEALKLYISIYAENYGNYPEITSLINISQMLTLEKHLADKANIIENYRVSYIKLLINKAQSSGLLNPNIDENILADLVVGSLIFIIYKWRKCSYGFALKEYMLNALEAILDSFTAH